MLPGLVYGYVVILLARMLAFLKKSGQLMSITDSLLSPGHADILSWAYLSIHDSEMCDCQMLITDRLLVLTTELYCNYAL